MVELVKVNSILDKKIYIVVPYSGLEKGIIGATYAVSSGGGDFLTQAKAALASKAENILSQLARMGLKARILEKEEIIRIYHDVYNGLAVEEGGLA